MRLSAGTCIGPYSIQSTLGAGGMGEVYRARDTRLGRDVALKVVAISLHRDPALRARFEREAQALAALNHPHIAAIYDVVDVGDHRAIVMELVAGETLAQVIERGPIPLRLAIGYAIDISDALSVAHAAGIVHRDLKPSNVVVTEGGSAKVLDFGIAKVGVTDEAAAKHGSTTTALTEVSVLVGTIGYMSPEQAHGRPADARSDIFSLGVVLHEAISGRRAFEGDTAAALLSAVLRDDPPPLRTLVPATPRAVERCVARCLEKDPRRRYQNATDLKAVLEDVREDLATPESAGGSRPVSPPVPVTIARRLLRPFVYLAASVAVGAAGFLAADTLRPAAVLTPSYRPFVTEAASANQPVWSPDGRTLAYVAAVDGRQHVYVRGIGATQSTLVTKEPSTSMAPFWSPDGSRIYFTRASDGNLVSVGAAGGEPQLVARTVEPKGDSGATGPRGTTRACIGPDGRSIVFSRGQAGSIRLWSLDTATGDSRPLEASGLPQTFVNVQALAFSPDGKTLAALASTTAANQSRGIWLVSWPGGSARHLLPDAQYLAAYPSLSWMPDSRRVVMSGYPVHGGTSRLLMADTVAGTLAPITGGKDTDGSPSVSPDGSRIAFVSQRSGMDLIQFPVDGGPPEPLLATSRAEYRPDMSASGVLAYVTDADGYPVVRLRSGADTWVRTVASTSEAERDRAAQPAEVRLSATVSAWP